MLVQNLTQPKDKFLLRLEELYAQAEAAQKPFEKFISRVCDSYPGAIDHPPLKTTESALRKLEWDEKEKRGKDPEILKDVVRATIVYKDLPSLYSAREFIKKQPEYKGISQELDAMKDRYQESSPTESGYRDIKFYIEVSIGNQNRTHICELQLNILHMVQGKEIEHPIYEIIRRAGSPPTDVTIKHEEAKKLGGNMRHTWWTLKEKGFLVSTEIETLRRIVYKFYPDGEHLATAPIIITKSDIGALCDLTPKIYEGYTQIASHAKVMKSGGLSPVMPSDTAYTLTKLKKK